MSEQLKTLPRWAIFILDLLCVIGALFLSRIIRHNFDLHRALEHIGFILPVVAGVNSVLFLLFRSYAGIIRYSNLKDMFRLVGVNAIATCIYFVIGVLAQEQGQGFLSNSGIATNFFVASFGLICYRVMVRHFYKLYFSDTTMIRKTRVAIYDTSHEGLIAKRLINDHPHSNLQAIVFLDHNSSKVKKKLDGLEIFPVAEHSLEKLNGEDVELILVAAQNVPPEKLNELVELANEFGVRVRQMPAVKRWLEDKPVSEQLKDINIADLLERDVIDIHNEEISGAVRGKKVLVTGAAGSIGSEIVRQLAKFNPALILVCDRAETELHELGLEMQESYPNAKIRSIIGNVCEEKRMRQLFEVYEPHFVFHAAAYKHVPLMEDHPSMAVINNVLGSKVLADLSVEFEVEKFVMVSTDKAVNPTNVMGASKRIAEIYAQSLYRHIQDGIFTGKVLNRKTRFITTRFGNVLGSNGSVIPRFQQQLAKGGPLTVTHPEITRYFMTIPEACQLVIEAGVMGTGGEIFVFDMGQPVKIAELARKMIRLSGKKPDVDIKVVFTGLRPGEKLYEELLSNSENTMPTYHQKIMIAKVREYEFAEVSEKISRLIGSAERQYTEETVRLMKDLVPEFKSKNSVFERLDGER